jgi:hypothetical protein
LPLTESRSVPANCRFEVDDAEDEWLYTQKFDFIHGRAMEFCFKDPAAVFQKAFHSCTPGGYFQMAGAALPIRCVDDSLEGTTLLKFANMMIEGMRMAGKDITQAPRYKSYMEAAGFIDVVEDHFQWPTNTWPKAKHHKTLGMLFNQDMQEGLSGIVMGICTRVYKMSPAEVEALVVDVKKDLNDRSIHAYQAM